MIYQSICNSFKVGLLNGVHNFSSHTFKIALYTSVASLDYLTTSYTGTVGEVVSAGYSVGGNTLTKVGPTTSGTTVYMDFDNTSWSNASLNFTASGALIYNDTASGKPSVAVLNFGIPVIATSTFTVSFPVADSEQAIIRIS